MTDMGANRTFPGVRLISADIQAETLSTLRQKYGRATSQSFELGRAQNGLLAGPRRPFH
jgi:hypothetical protein